MERKPIPLDPTPNFGLGEARYKGDNLFVQMKKAIQFNTKGTIFQEGMMANCYTFVKKWHRVTSKPLRSYELRKILKRKLVIEGEAPESSKKRSQNQPQKTSFKSRLPKECNLTMSIENV